VVNTSYRKSATATKEEDRRANYRGKPLELMALKLASKARADNTQRNYRGAQRQFKLWCADRDVEPLEASPADLVQYLCHLAVQGGKKGLGYPPATVKAKLAALRRFFRDAKGRDNVAQSEEVRSVWSGIQREFSQRTLQASPMTLDIIRLVLAALPDRDGNIGMKQLRDRALMLVGYGCGFRRSEISSLRVEDVRFEEGGATLFLRHSKGDQLARGQWVGLGEGQGETCPVAALRAWLDAAGPGTYVFRPVNRWGKVEDRDLSHHAVGLIVKGLVQLADLDPDGFSGHSLRSGIITDLVASGMSMALIMERSRHRSALMIGTYHRPSSALKTNFTRQAGA
jgi:site-specific recombinase XerD